ncbi:MAG: hypothetical protein NZ898_13075 [Myxococcota bacterium]|nr:hypothetical protein [Myxococcota bacterium]MDW8363679.1 hypothetical protein [Myxococcales bacterium]
MTAADRTPREPFGIDVAAELVLWGARREVHEFHAGPGTFASAVESITGRPVVTPVTRSNLHVLAELPRLLRVHGASRWTLDLRPPDRGPWPRLAVAVPYALHAASCGCALDLAVALRGAPACLLGPYRNLGEPVSGSSFAPVCTSCAWRDECHGVDARYLDRFGDAELRPQRD